VTTAVEIPVIKLSVQQHNGEERLFANFPYDKELSEIKSPFDDL